MTPAILYSEARKALRLSMECERSSLDYDQAWHDYMKGEAQRHRERAAWYLDRRAMMQIEPELPLEHAA
jgi:hypothetical protein